MTDETRKLAIWEQMVGALAFANLDGLECYDRSQTQSWEPALREYVLAAVETLPWQFRKPMKLYSTVLGIASIVLTGRRPTSLSPSQRIRLVRKLRLIPAFGTLEKLVRAMVMLSLFDMAPRRHDQAERQEVKTSEV